LGHGFFLLLRDTLPVVRYAIRKSVPESCPEFYPFAAKRQGGAGGPAERRREAARSAPSSAGSDKELSARDARFDKEISSQETEKYIR